MVGVGPLFTARDIIQSLLNDFLPPEISRIAYNDVVYNAVTGKKINFNGIIERVSKLICDTLKQGIAVQKAFIEDTVQ